MKHAKARILLITPEYPPDHGGVAEYLYGVVAHFSGTIRVLTGPFFWKHWWPHWFKGVFTVWRAVRADTPDFIWISHILPMGYIARVVQVVTGTPYMVFVHGMDICLPENSPWKRWWMRHLLRHAILVVANSRFTANRVETEGVPAQRIYILYPCGQMFEEAIDAISSTQSLLKKLRDKKIILSVGRMIERKGQMRALKALTPLLKKNNDLHYVLIGTGPDRGALHSYITVNKLKERATVISSIANKELPLWYAKAAVFVLPTVSCAPDVEGFGLVFVEAGRYGVPVVGGRGGGVDEVIQDGVNGLLIDGNNEEEIRGAVEQLLTDGVLRRRLGEQGKVRAQERFNLSQRVAEFAERVYAFLPPPAQEQTHENALRQALVSVIIPAYNHIKELRATLKTLHAQTYGPLEIIVVDDGSTDGTEKALTHEAEKWQGRRSFAYTKIAHKGNNGAAIARNTGIKQARGTLVIFWDADIIAEPQMIEKMVKTLKNNPHAAFAYSSFYFGWKKFVCGAFDADRLKKMNYITTTSLIRREFFPGFDESLTRFQDWDVWLTISERGGKGVWVPEALFRITPRENGMSRWLPSCAYNLRWLHKWKPVQTYREARVRIIKKHHLV